MAKKFEPENPTISFEFERNDDGTFDVEVTAYQGGIPLAGFGGAMLPEELRALSDRINSLLSCH